MQLHIEFDEDSYITLFSASCEIEMQYRQDDHFSEPTMLALMKKTFQWVGSSHVRGSDASKDRTSWIFAEAKALLKSLVRNIQNFKFYV